MRLKYEGEKKGWKSTSYISKKRKVMFTIEMF